MGRIHSLNMSVSELIITMADGVPGASQVLIQMSSRPEDFAPENPIGSILALDSLEIYGLDIWGLSHYVCQDDMKRIKQVLDNYSFGYLTKETLKEHIKNAQPFEKLYTVEEMGLDICLRKLPQIEKEQSEQFLTEETQDGSEDCSAPLAGPAAIADTDGQMNVYDLIELLKQRGFRLGYEVLEEYDAGAREQIRSQVYYQPEQSMLVRLTVPEDRNSPLARLDWFAGQVYAQRDSRPGEVFCFDAASEEIRNELGESLGYYYEKDIRSGLFGWYDSIVEHTKPRLKIVPDGASDSRIMCMFNSKEQERYSNKFAYKKSANTLSLFGPYRDITAFYNMTQIRDKGLKQILERVMKIMPRRVEAAIFEILNGDEYRPHERNEEALYWLMDQLGVNGAWFRQHGVDYDLALIPPKSFTLAFTIDDPKKILRRCNYREVDTFIIASIKKFEEETGIVVPSRYAQARNCERWRDKLEFEFYHLNTRFNEKEAARVMQSVLRKKGLVALVDYSPLDTSEKDVEWVSTMDK